MLCGLVALSLLVAEQTAALAAPPEGGTATGSGRPTAPEQVPSVPGHNAVPASSRPDAEPAAPTRAGAPRVAWPAAGAAEVALSGNPTTKGGAPPARRAGALPIWVSPSTHAGGNGPASVHVALADRAAAARVGTNGPLFTVRRADGDTTPGWVAVTVDYSTLRDSFGADWAYRLGLTAAGNSGGSKGTAGAGGSVRSVRNDVAAARLTADVAVTGVDSGFAVTAAASGSTGDYRATSLAPSGNWQVSQQSGTFSWSYPMRTPPVPGGLSPELVASYSSSGVDGRTVSTNNQPSWVGEGWNLWPGYIERSYRPCAEDTDTAGRNNTQVTGDLCWETDNATMSFADHSTRLVLENGTWRPESDDGTRVEHLLGDNTTVGNGDDNNEYWRVTTTDGVQYYFGRNRLPGWTSQKAETKSTWTVPVYGNDPSEPCHAATFAASACSQAYRWNLDHVVDPHGNSMSYFYAPETNSYAQNLGAVTGTYVRGGTLLRAEYGTREGQEYASPVARVVFDTAERCLSSCATHDATTWPDTPWDQACTAAPCGERFSPTFWDTRRLTRITTQVSTGNGGFRGVDQWDLAHTFPAPGDGTTAGLWLNTLTHTGVAGTATPLPAMRFDGTMKPNRVNSTTDGLPALNKNRITTIWTEAGGSVNVSYAPPDCAPGATPPAADTNTRRCVPVRWAMPPATEPVDDWFHKYVVAQVVEDDGVSGDKDTVTSYEYTGGAAWAYSDNPLLTPKQRTWSDWRGYGQVTVHKGDPVNDVGKPQTTTFYRYFRGMDGDRTAAGGTKGVAVVDTISQTSLPDAEPLAGFLREEIAYDGDTAHEVTGTLHDPWTRLTATQGALKAYQVQEGRTTARATLSSGGYRTTRVDTTFDVYGNATRVDDVGDLARSDDDQCTTTTYAQNTGAMLVTLPSRVTTVGVACAATPSFPDDLISDTRTAYDGGSFGAAPSRGDATATDVAKSYSGGTPTYLATDRSTYDSRGRVLTSTDALGRTTGHTYTDTNGLTAQTTETNALGHSTTTTLDPAWGQPLSTVDPNGRTTTQVYDALGRVSRVYKPGRSPSTGDSPHLRFTYDIRAAAPSYVRTDTITANGNAVSHYAVVDGFYRQRQTQEPSPQGGRILTDTLYNSRGLVSVTRAPYYDATTAPGSGLFIPDAGKVPAATVNSYDGAERPTASVLTAFNAEKWKTTTRYDGDRVDVVPPAGGTATTTFTDARGQTTAVWQYHDRNLSTGHDTTTYTYTKRGDLATLTDPAGNVWRYGYDLLGRRLTSDGPDQGRRTMTYDDAGHLTSSTDARGRTVAVVLDALGRPTETHADSPTGTLLTRRVYDTLSKGQLTSATRYVGGAAGHAYTTTVTGYDAAGLPSGTAVTIPDSEGNLAGTYTTTATYGPDGSPLSEGLPALGDVTAETLVHGYDDLGRSDTLTGTLPYVADTTYTALGEPSQLASGAKPTRVWRTTFRDDATRRTDRVLTESDSTTAGIADDLRYSYHPAGNVTRIAEQTTGSAWDTQCFAYDHLRRMTSAWTATDDCAAAPSTSVIGGPAPYWQEFRFDATGNRTSLIHRGFGGTADTASTYTYPGAGTALPHAVRSVQTGTRVDRYDYDAAGNTTSRPGPSGQQTLAWNGEGLLDSVTAGAQSTSYVYDADGKQLLRHDPGSVTLFLGGGEIRLDTATGALAGTRYYPGTGIRTAAGFTWVFGDQHGTAQLAVDPATLVPTARRTDPFGNPRGTTAPWPGDRGFVDGTTNESTGLTRLGAREYDPGLGRFLSVDPVTDPTDPQQLNGYAYASNNPTSMSDPDGLKYFVDADGYVTAPPAAGWTKRAAQRVQLRVMRFRSYYRKVQRYQHTARMNYAFLHPSKPRLPIFAPPKQGPFPIPPPPPDRSRAKWNDFGAGCTGDQASCDAMSAEAARDRNTARHDPGSSCPKGDEAYCAAGGDLSQFEEKHSFLDDIGDWIGGAATFVWDHASSLAGLATVLCLGPGGIVCGAIVVGLTVVSAVKDGIGCFGDHQAGSCLQLAAGAVSAVGAPILAAGRFGKTLAPTWDGAWAVNGMMTNVSEWESK